MVVRGLRWVVIHRFAILENLGADCRPKAPLGEAALSQYTACRNRSRCNNWVDDKPQANKMKS